MRFGISGILGQVFFTLVLFAACAPEIELQEIPQIPVNQTEEELTEFRNCRAILTARESVDHKTKIVSVIFSIAKNQSYDPAIGDACDGDLANLWQDLERYDKLIEKHDRRVLHFTFIAPKLEYFPKTYRELVLFIDDAAKADRDHINPNQYSRTVLEDVLKLRSEYGQLIFKEAPKYYANAHAPIINKYLRKHELQMAKYDAGEKLSFCIVAWDNCIQYFPANKKYQNTLGRDLDILYAGSWDWWKVEPLEEK